MLQCPKCQGESGVRDSRPIGHTIRRRRECKQCRWRWSTFELAAEYMHAVRVITRSAREMLASSSNLLADLEKIGDTLDDGNGKDSA